MILATPLLRVFPNRISFSPLAWLKLQWFCHAGPTEVGGFGISAENNLLHIEDFVTVKQYTTPMTVRFGDQAVADLYDELIDKGLPVCRFARVWIHTHPCESAQPSSTDTSLPDDLYHHNSCSSHATHFRSRVSPLPNLGYHRAQAHSPRRRGSCRRL